MAEKACVTTHKASLFLPVEGCRATSLLYSNLLMLMRIAGRRCKPPTCDHPRDLLPLCGTGTPTCISPEQASSPVINQGERILCWVRLAQTIDSASLQLRFLASAIQCCLGWTTDGDKACRGVAWITENSCRAACVCQLGTPSGDWLSSSELYGALVSC